MTTSLVVYEDSESEEDSFNQTEEQGSAPFKKESCKEGQQVRDFSFLDVTSSPHASTANPHRTVLEYHEKDSSSRQLQKCFDTEIKYYNHIAGERDFGDNATHLSLPGTKGKVSPLQALPHIPQGVFDGSKTAKRHCNVPSGVRPYIPKRQRLVISVEKADPNNPAEQVHTRDNQLLSDVSAKIKLYLGHKPAAAGIPRKLLMSLEGHQGPVNKVQWCPMPHLSHLLLSASMDKSFKVWDGAESGRCLRVYTCHSGAVRDACWTPCGRHLLTGSFDNTAVITDVETGQQTAKLDNQFKVMCAVLHPSNPEIFLCGGYSSMVKAWDARSSKVVKVYKAGIQQTLDILFLRGGVDLITSSDCVSRDSADRTLIAWDFQTTAKVSNQIYHERYTCPSLALHPLEDSFVAQTNGNYVAVFSSQRPYRMNKRRQYEGHKVEGYAVQCEFSQDGTILASGSSTGSAHFYDYQNTRMLRTLQAHSQPCLCVSQHPVLPATMATCDWAGEIKVWH